MAAITSTNVASAIVKLVAADALPVLVGNLVMGNLVNRDYEPVLAQCRRHSKRTDSADDGGEQHPRRLRGADAKPESGKRADRAQYARGSDFPDSGRDQGAGGSGPAEDLHAAVGGRHRPENRDRPSEPVPRLHDQHAGGDGGDADHGSRDRRGGDRAVPVEGPASRAEVHCGGRGDVFDLAADSALQRVPERGRRGPARD